MRTETYTKFVSRMQALMGVDAANTTELAEWRQYFQRNMRYAWDFFEWPEVCEVEERVPDLGGYIALDEQGHEDIGEVLACFDGDPDGSDSVGDVPYRIVKDGLKVTPGEYESVWVYFRRQMPEYNAADYGSGTAYAVGDETYYPTTGKFYEALVATTGNAPTDESYWKELPIPRCLFEYVAQASYADALLPQGFAEKSRAMKADARGLLEIEVDKVARQQRQRRLGGRIQTHGTAQLRDY